MQTSEYLDCELYLTDYDRARLSVAGRDYSGQPHLDEALQRRLLQAALNPTQYGSFLFEALLPGDGDDLLAGYREGLAIAQHEEKCLCFRLHIENTAPTILQDLNWELLYDPKRKVALGRSRETTFSRYLTVPLRPVGPVEAQPRLLVVLSTPANLADYKLAEIDREQLRQSMKKALSPLTSFAACELLEGPATPERISDRLLAGHFHALHVCAHGALRPHGATASLVLEAEDGSATFVDETWFSDIFEGDKDLRLVTLVACHGGAQPRSDPFSGLGPAVVQRGIPAVVAMRREISIDAAIRFTEHFYTNLARSGRVDTAVNEARRQLHLTNPSTLEWGTPALFMRLPEGRLWPPARPTRPPSLTPRFPWPYILQCIHRGNIVPLLGPGMFRGLLPTGEEIAARWASEFNYPTSESITLPRVAQFVHTRMRGYPYDELSTILTDDLMEREEVKDRQRLRSLNSLSEVIRRIAERHFDRDEGEPHRILAELPISTYLTTSYDSFMTAALYYVGKKPLRRSCIWNRDLDNRREIEEYEDLSGSPDEPLVFHLFGNDEDPTSQILTEDDHLDFLGVIVKDFEHRIPSRLGADLSDSMLLFLGYDVQTLDCRVLFRGVIRQLREPPRRPRLAVLQFKGEEKNNAELQSFIKRYCDNLHIEAYDGTVREFLAELRDRWRNDNEGR